MQNRLRFSFRDKSAADAGASPQSLSPAVKSILGAPDSEADKREWVVTNANGKILCTRLQDIASVRATATGVELQIGRQTYEVREDFEAWKSRLPADRFVLRGTSLLLNRKRLKSLDAALSSIFERRSTFATSSGNARPDSSRR